MKGRGRISSIDRLPSWADEAVMWAYGALKERGQTQLEILDEFNAKLRALAWEEAISDAPQISKSAFNRSAMRLATMARRLGETREIASVLASKFETGGDEDLTLLLSETIKALTYEMLENAGELHANGMTAEMLMNSAKALKAAEEAKRITADVKTKIDKEFKKKADEAVNQVAQSKGLSEETVTELKRKLFGMSHVNMNHVNTKQGA